MKVWALFVIGAVISWGVYVPMIHRGQELLGKSPLRAFLCVGIAYFLTAILVPGALLLTKGEDGAFNTRGIGFSFAAGVAGAAGALCVILSLKFGAKPIYVAPLVFAGAPIINTLITIAWHPPKAAPHPIFYVGILLAAAGAGIVLWFKPT